MDEAGYDARSRTAVAEFDGIVAAARKRKSGGFDRLDKPMIACSTEAHRSRWSGRATRPVGARRTGAGYRAMRSGAERSVTTGLGFTASRRLAPARPMLSCARGLRVCHGEGRSHQRAAFTPASARSKRSATGSTRDRGGRSIAQLGRRRLAMDDVARPRLPRTARDGTSGVRGSRRHHGRSGSGVVRTQSARSYPGDAGLVQCERPREGPCRMTMGRDEQVAASGRRRCSLSGRSWVIRATATRARRR